jgi:hypothetical protein
MRVIDVVLEIGRIEDTPEGELIIVIGLQHIAEAGAGTF